jgi:hypothetical protein
MSVESLVAVGFEVQAMALAGAIAHGQRALFAAIEAVAFEEPARVELVAGGLLK